MIETLLGGLLGGAFRLAPEVLKWLDRKGVWAVRKLTSFASETDH